MRTKSFRKKLNLNKKTIANLGTDKMSRVNGGGEESLSFIPNCYTCETCPTDTCPTNTCDECQHSMDCQSDPDYITCRCTINQTFECC